MDTKHYLKVLTERREAIAELSRMSSDSRRAVELDQTKVGRLSRMDAMQQQEMAKASEQKRAAELRRIDAALARIDEGEFGYCLDCGEEISEKRLEVDPATPRCIDCANA
ncbi:MAG: TraR/DksA family transcriptional regulator [Minwuia sp.]|uniref:TraR/DksA family transcriptional regulator n=1 Tax=Minwuia sp. TaxID=2493630 RepID=UPI003A88EBC2